MRLGDVSSAALVFVGTTLLGASSIGFARINIVLAVIGLALALMVGRGYQRRTAAPPAAAVPGALPAPAPAPAS